MFDDLWNDIKTSVRERVNSPFYGAFAISWCLLHWQVFAVLFFVDEHRIFEKTGLLKNEFIFQYFLNPAELIFWIQLLITIVLACAIIWLLPRLVSRPAYKAQQEDVVAKANIKIEAEKRLAVQKGELIDEEIENLEKQRKKVSVEQEVKQIPEKQWSQEYVDFEGSVFFSNFELLLESYYKHEGQIKWTVDQFGDEWKSIPTDLLAYAHSSGIVELSLDAESISFTEKGKYFVNRYTIEKTI